MTGRPTVITKLLSKNDTGETGGHQAGILIPREPTILAFFPRVESAEYNPRHLLYFTDPHGKKWEFALIYYNNRFFGGTRNEYRLTRMTPFMRTHNLAPGDTLVFTRDDRNRFSINYRRRNEPASDGVLKIGSTWKVISLRGQP